MVDNLSRGHRDAVPPGATFVAGRPARRRGDRAAPRPGIDGALHFAAYALVGESVAHPELYWRNNVVGSLNLLDALRAAGVPRLVFSSTCATYGVPEVVPMDETTPTRPVNPYGTSKLAVDRMIGDDVPGARARRGQPALLQRRRRARAVRRGPRARDAPDPERPAGGGRRDRPRRDLRHRLPDARRDRGPRLHPRRGSRRRAPARDRCRAPAGSTASSTSATAHGFSVREVIEAAREVTGLRDPGRRAAAAPGRPAGARRARGPGS